MHTRLYTFVKYEKNMYPYVISLWVVIGEAYSQSIHTNELLYYSCNIENFKLLKQLIQT